jgi:hypothetical protein
MQSRVIFRAYLSRLTIGAYYYWKREKFGYAALLALIATIFPLYLFLGLMLSDNWHNDIVIGTIAVVIAIQNMSIWITGARLY